MGTNTMHLIGRLSPVVHHANLELIRVPLRKVNDKYIVYVADGFHRLYDSDTLPDKLKSKMAMVLARGNDKALFTPESKLQKMTVYINAQSDELDEVGWQVSDTYYCLVLDVPTLESLKGE